MPSPSSASHLRGGPAAPVPETRGRILNYGWRYDLMEWFLDRLLLRGKLRELRKRTADLARLQLGESVLDVGCGTGTLAILVQPRVGPSGRVVGIDPGTQQIARARTKAARQHLPIDFRIGVIDRLDLADQSMDVVLSTLMMHHLPDDLKRQGLSEIARVLKPGGRLVIADFRRTDKHPESGTSLGAGRSDVQDLPALIQAAGLNITETDEMPFPHMHGASAIGYLVATKPESGR